MGLLNRQDAKIFRGYFNEMVKLIGQSVGYQYIVKRELTIHSEDNSILSAPIRIDILFDENPQVDTLNRLGWVSELNQQKPIVINMPYNTPNLTVNARVTIESVDGVARPRVFKITKIVSDLEFPDAYTCAIVPVFDQYVQKNQYTLVNHEKINQNAKNIEKIALVDKYTVADKVKEMYRALIKYKKFNFNKLFSVKKRNKNEVVTAFSGLLEMSRRNKVITEQEEIFGDIEVEKNKKV